MVGAATIMKSAAAYADAASSVRARYCLRIPDSGSEDMYQEPSVGFLGSRPSLASVASPLGVSLHACARRYRTGDRSEKMAMATALRRPAREPAYLNDSECTLRT